MRSALAAGLEGLLFLGLLFPLTILAVTWDFMPAREFIDKPVVDRQGRTLGEVEDLVLDVRNARVHYVVLSFDGWLGLSEELYALPISALAPHAGGRLVRLDPAGEIEDAVLALDSGLPQVFSFPLDDGAAVINQPRAGG